MRKLKAIFQASFVAIVVLLCAMPFAKVYAQDNNAKDESVKSLSEILNPTIDDGSTEPLTTRLMANEFYKKCTKQKTNVFNENDLKIMCSCNAAKMSEILSIKEFQELEQDNNKGRDARGKMLAYAYAPCMEYVLSPIVREDCYNSPTLNDVLRGKKSICQCVNQRFRNYISTSAPNIIMSAIQNDRMTTNPLERLFTSGTYFNQRDQFIKSCRYKIQYDRENKR